MVSLYHTRFSSAGEGNCAFIYIPGPEGMDAICTDNSDVAEFVATQWIRGKGGPFDRGMPLLQARFQRGGDIRTRPLDRGD
jgi:hypothetical protein